MLEGLVAVLLEACLFLVPLGQWTMCWSLVQHGCCEQHRGAEEGSVNFSSSEVHCGQNGLRLARLGTNASLLSGLLRDISSCSSRRS